MKVQVGSTIRFRGVECICTSIRKTTESIFAKESSEVFRLRLTEPVNCTYLNLNVGRFAEKDIVCINMEQIELTAPGRNIFFIYPKYEVHKEGEERIDEFAGNQEGDGEAGGSETEGAGSGAGGGTGVGESGVGEAGAPVYGNG